MCCLVPISSPLASPAVPWSPTQSWRHFGDALALPCGAGLEGDAIFLDGEGASVDGDRPFLDRGRAGRSARVPTDNGPGLPVLAMRRTDYAVALFRKRPVSVSPSAIKTVTPQTSSSPVVTGWSSPFGAGNFSLIVGINFDE